MKRLPFVIIAIFLLVAAAQVDAQTADGYIVVGYGASFDAMDKYFDMYAFRLDTSGNKVWRKQYGTYDWDWGWWVEQTTDGGYILLGTATRPGAALYFFLNKIDTGGSSQWQKVYGTDYERGSCVRQTADGGYILAGDSFVYNQTGDDFDFLVYKVDATGKKEWRKHYGGEDDEMQPTVFQTADGGYILAGYTNSYHHGAKDGDLVVYRLDSAGQKLWRRNYGGFYADGWRGEVAPAADGGFVAVTQTSTYVHGMPGVDDDFLIYKFDSAGAKQWRKNFGGNWPDGAESVQQTADGGYIVAGWTQSYLHATMPVDDYDCLVYKLDASGNKQWRKNFGGIYTDMAICIRQTADGGYVLCGETESFTHGNLDMLVYKLNAQGQKEWRKNFGGTSRDHANCVRQTFH